MRPTCFEQLFPSHIIVRNLWNSRHSLPYTLKACENARKETRGRSGAEAESELPIIVATFPVALQLGVTSYGFLRDSLVIKHSPDAAAEAGAGSIEDTCILDTI